MNYILNELNNIPLEKKDFWSSYLNVLLKEDVQKEKVSLYMRWATQFARFMKGKPLDQCTVQEVNSFLNHLRNQSNVKKWQVEEAINALRLLFRDFLRVPWALRSVDQKKAVSATAGSSTISSCEYSYNTIIQGESPHKRVYSAYKDVFERLRIEIRVRHYSIRTEQAYEHWIRRFLYFYKM